MAMVAGPATATTTRGSTISSSSSNAVVIETSTPIRPRRNRFGPCALFVGFLLVLHTPLWILLVFYKEYIWSSPETDGDERESEAAATTTTTTSFKVFLQFLSRLLLEFTPWFANAMLSIFFGVLFLLIGRATLAFPDPEKH